MFLGGGGGGGRGSGGGRGAAGAVGSEPLMPYRYGYAVQDDIGNDFNQQEQSDGAQVTGQYSVLLPDGRIQTVTYSVRPETGFVVREYLWSFNSFSSLNPSFVFLFQGHHFVLKVVEQFSEIKTVISGGSDLLLIVWNYQYFI